MDINNPSQLTLAVHRKHHSLLTVTEARFARVETDITYLKRDGAEIKGDLKDIRRDMRTDFRMMFGALITLALGLAGMMARGFHWL